MDMQKEAIVIAPKEKMITDQGEWFYLLMNWEI